MVFFTVLFLLASVGLGERRQKGTRAQTCFTPSKKFNLLIFYFIAWVALGGNASTGEHAIKGEQGHSLILLRVIYLFPAKTNSNLQFV